MQLSELREKGFNLLDFVLVNVWVVLPPRSRQERMRYLIFSWSRFVSHQVTLTSAAFIRTLLSGRARNFNPREKK